MLWMILLSAMTAFLAFSNGANDNFKGVATLFGSGTTSYRTAIAWATATTVAGSVASAFFAETLLRKFTGKGLVSDDLASTLPFLLAVATGGGLTVILATRLGFPISTTHGLIGAMVGAGWASAGVSGVKLSGLGASFLFPLLLSPVLAIALGTLFYGLFRVVRRWSTTNKPICVCVEVASGVEVTVDGVAQVQVGTPTFTFARSELGQCGPVASGAGAVGADTSKLLDGVHFLSAGAVSFARGLNDTPKMAALLLFTKAALPTWNIALVAAAIALGGLLAARRVGETMSQKITVLDPEHGLVANLVTAALVLSASLFGLPVSTTHVAVGSLFGVGLTTGRANLTTVASISLSWLVTLPCAAAISALVYVAFRPMLG